MLSVFTDNIYIIPGNGSLQGSEEAKKMVTLKRSWVKLCCGRTSAEKCLDSLNSPFILLILNVCDQMSFEGFFHEYFPFQPWFHLHTLYTVYTNTFYVFSTSISTTFHSCCSNFLHLPPALWCCGHPGNQCVHPQDGSQLFGAHSSFLN